MYFSVNTSYKNCMKETLKRELSRTYLIISSEGVPYEETYEIEMILKNEPESILPLHVLRADGHIQLFYEVSAKQSLKDFIQRSKLSAETIRTLFECLEQLMKEVKNYLLDMDCVVLDLEHIYMQDSHFYFCYCPWEKKEVLSSFRELLEEILGNLDYHNTEGVELAYHLYQSACKGNFSIAEILAEHSKGQEDSQKITEVVCPDTNDIPLEQYEERKEESCDRKKGFAYRILQFFLKKEKKQIQYEEKIEDLRKDGILAEDRSYRNVSELPEGNTMLLTNVSWRHWILRPTLSNYDEFCITGDSFLIGKKKDCVDGYIGKDTISRIHSRLFVDEGRLYVADANSTNGTYVNGESIPPGEDIEIFPGDRILFADVEYECYNSL